MSKTITVNGVDETALIRLANQVWVEAAYGGEVGLGGFDRDDAALGDVPALKAITVIEDAATPTRLFTGYIGTRGLSRGVLPRVTTQRQWDVTVLDLNTVLDDEIFSGAGANRPEETDYARISWLLTTGAIAALGITAGPIPNTNTADMDAVDYRGYGPRRVLDECAEAAGKNFFIYDWGSGYKLYYDKHTGTSLSSTLRLSSVLADVDSTTTFGIEDPALEKDPNRIYSRIRFSYGSGGAAVWVNDAAIETAYRRREFAISDTSVKTATKATAKATRYLAKSSTEVETFTCSVSLPAASVNLIRAGQRIEIKCPHLGIAGFEWFRITRREVTPQSGRVGVSDVRYTLRLEFAEDVAFANFGGPRGLDDGPGGGGVDEDGNPTHDHPDAGGGIPDDLACRTYGTALTVSGPTGIRRYGFGGYPDTAYTGSSLTENISWPGTPCGIGPGGWSQAEDQEVWRSVTAPADSEYLGLEIMTNPGAIAGDFQGYYVSVADTLPTVYGEGARFTGHLQVGSNTLLAPRNLIPWGATTYILTSPAWNVPQPGFVCADAASPLTNGQGGSGQSQISVTARTVEFCAGAAGAAGWVGGIGLVDGENRTYELIHWSGTGPVEATVNGLEVDGLELDRTAKTVTFLSAPPPDSAILFDYTVAAP